MAIANAINSGQTLDSSSSPQFTGLNLSGPTASLSLFLDGSKNVTTTGTTAFSQGGFGFSTATTGDIFYASATNTPGKLADVATGQVLVSGGVGSAPSYSASPTLTGLTLASANNLTLTAITGAALTISSATGVANTADLHLNRFDLTNGNNRVVYSTSATNDWSVGCRGNSQNYVVFDETNVLAQLTLTKGSGTSGTAIFAGSITINNASTAITMQNGASISAKNSGGSTEIFMYPRFGDNKTYMDIGSAGATFRQDAAGATWMSVDTSSNVTFPTGGVTISGLTASLPVFTDGAKKLVSTGTVGVANGGTGTATAFTLGSVVVAGASGVYTQDNANLFYDVTGHNMYLGCTTATTLAVTGRLNILGTNAGIGGTTAWLTSADQYPLIQNLPYAHDNVHINLDSYFDGTNWKSSTVNNNFQISKTAGDLYIHYAAAVAAAGTISWSNSICFDHLGNVGIGGLASAGGGTQVLFILNGTTAPTTNPSGGGILYAQAGAGKWRGSSGTVTTFGPAEPHCPVCESDFGLEWNNESYGGTLRVCIKCLSEDMGNKPYIRWNE